MRSNRSPRLAAVFGGLLGPARHRRRRDDEALRFMNDHLLRDIGLRREATVFDGRRLMRF